MSTNKFKRFNFVAFWHLTSWGFLFNNDPWSALKLNRGCDEWHNPSRWLIVPLIGEFIFWKNVYGRDGEQHVHAFCNGVFTGIIVEGCSICSEFIGEINEP